jgi:predicted N-formylglutamate amidohydrolase
VFERPQIVLTCEHASNAVPASVRQYFDATVAVMRSHRAWDIGTLDIAHYLARRLRARLFKGKWSRLVIELNRSPHHSSLFSEFMSSAPPALKEQLLSQYYEPHRSAVEATIRSVIRQEGKCVHLAIHSFTPILNGHRRQADVGFLYDPGRKWERRVVDELAFRLKALAPNLRIRRNYPYRGTSDGLTTHLRTRLPPSKYAGIELELNQALLMGGHTRELKRQLFGMIAAVAG